MAPGSRRPDVRLLGAAVGNVFLDGADSALQLSAAPLQGCYDVETSNGIEYTWTSGVATIGIEQAPLPTRVRFDIFNLKG